MIVPRVRESLDDEIPVKLLELRVLGMIGATSDEEKCLVPRDVECIDETFVCNTLKTGRPMRMP